MTRIAFHRPARMLLPELPSDTVMLPAPPEEPQENPSNGAWSLVMPLLSSVGMAAYMVTFGRPALIIIGVLFFVTSTGAVIAMRMQQRSATGKTTRKQRARYRALLAVSRDRAREMASAQRDVAALRHPEPARLWFIATTRQRVWERRQSDPDFLRVRLGVGAVRLTTPLEVDGGLDPLTDYDWESQQAVNRLLEQMGRVEQQPMVADVGGAGVISVVGGASRTEPLVRALLCHIAVLHAPDDVTIAVETGGSPSWDWAKWLPHTFEPKVRGAAGTVSLVAGEPELLAGFLQEELRQRLEQQKNRRTTASAGRDGAPPQRRLVVVFAGFAPFSEWGRSELMTALLMAAGPLTGLTLVFLTDHDSGEPGRVDLRLRIDGHGRIVTEGRTELITVPAADCAPEAVTPEFAELIARAVAPLRLSDEREQLLARVTSLTEMVFGVGPEDADVTARWVGPGDTRLLRAPIGTDGDGDVVVLDIKESAQGGSGPHGLIVGATGSGKSELLRTLVTGLALTHPPDLLNFVLIDFKGGAAFAPLTGLPHVAGLITNLADDLAMIDRVLAALMGEQQRRQRMLRDAGNVDTIRDYQMRRAAGVSGPDGRPLDPLPYLIIIVDEFGELLSGRPDFAELFTQIGRVGRSLGMHLLMATQRLEEGKLRGLDSHLSYRICLRTFSAAESRSVIGTTDAYQLPPIPGSAYLKVDESIYTRLRVAHVSAHYAAPETRGAAGHETTPVAFQTRTTTEPVEQEPDDAAPATQTGPTELQIVVERLGAAAAPAHQVWLPPLPTTMALDQLLGRPAVQEDRGFASSVWPLSGRLAVPLGMLDLPLRQRQETLVMDFAGAHGHLAAVGAPRTGRSTLLRTIMISAMLTHTPDEMQFYCIDYGGGSLYPLCAAPHVGSVAGRTEPELVSRILAEIRALIVERERLLRGLGIDSVGDLRARRAAGTLPEGTRSADVFLLIDNWGALRTEFEGAEQVVTEIAARGLGAGIHLVLTTGRWMDIRPALRDSIGTRIELRLNDPAESEINRRLAAGVPADAAGRGLAAPGVFFHLVLPRVDGKDSADGLREAQQEVVATVAQEWAGTRAPEIRLLPQYLEVHELDAPAEETAVPIGVDEAGLATVSLDLAGTERNFLIYGDAGSGKTTLLRTMLTGLTQRQSPYDIRVVLFDYRRSLLDVVPADHLGAYAGDSASAQTYVQQVVDKLRERLPPPEVSPAQLRARDWWEGSEIYVVADDYDLLTTGTPALNPLAEFIPQAREVGLHVILARRVTGAARGFGDQMTARIRDMGSAGLILSGDHREGALIGDERAVERPPGRGVLVQRGRPSRLLHVATTPVTDPAS
ncbi:type VII secretion protein EccCb [Mangrovihabitans endophyticus]|uniref:Type VII secretion protein EccC n=1 Tax=Mangrovihabitans endophyticus TaxID=1751298 RepID=A0A8J3FLU5_9ACTN|nr:type VII secretion protein EccCb [Mangrovihabitans endophyticus]GGK78693.1 type VII secretion protein EccC [Mangrovihabitans endophyticus]